MRPGRQYSTGSKEFHGPTVNHSMHCDAVVLGTVAFHVKNCLAFKVFSLCFEDLKDEVVIKMN